jgi:hypothetical protein
MPTSNFITEIKAMKNFSRCILAGAVALFGNIACAAPTTLTFDDAAAGTSLNAAYAGLGVTFNDTATVIAGGGGVTSQPNFASGSANTRASLELVFDLYATSITAYNVTLSSFTLSAYDSHGLLLGSGSTSDFGPRGFVSLTNIGQIKSARFTSTGLYGIDDLSFDAASTGEVPEPASFALVGIGILGFAGSWRKRKAQHAHFQKPAQR